MPQTAKAITYGGFTMSHKHSWAFRSAVAAVLLLAVQSVAFAQATRTWVSGVGDDANPCSRTAPCKTFAGAISKTAAGGEISVLDPGGFGAVTITKSITINNVGNTAGILGAATNGVIVNAGATDRVTLRGFNIEGAGTGLNGVRFLAGGELVVEDCQITNFRGNTASSGIYFAPSGASRLSVQNCTISGNGQPGGGSGIFISPGAAGKALVTIDNTRLLNNTSGLRSNGRTMVTLRNSLVAGSLSSGVLAIGSSTEVSSMTIQSCLIANNGATNASSAGVYANGELAVIRLSDSTVTGNAYGLRAVFDADILSTGDNIVEDNLNDGSPTGTVPLH